MRFPISAAAPDCNPAAVFSITELLRTAVESTLESRGIAAWLGAFKITCSQVLGESTTARVPAIAAPGKPAAKKTTTIELTATNAAINAFFFTIAPPKN